MNGFSCLFLLVDHDMMLVERPADALNRRGLQAESERGAGRIFEGAGE
jgi:hypothetical protein